MDRAGQNTVDDKTQLSSTERLLLLVPLAGGAFFGLGSFLFGSAPGPAFGFAGHDPFVYRMAGAATMGYVIALLLGIMQTEWARLRLVVIATLVFNLGSLYACIVAIIGGGAQPVVYAILLASILIVAITGWILSRHQGAPLPPADLPQAFTYLIELGALLSLVFGVLALFAPVQVGQILGYKGTDDFVFRQAGAPTLGYAVMAYFAVRSRRQVEIILPGIMAFVFNGLSFVASLIAIFSGETNWVLYLIAVASLALTIIIFVVMQRAGAFATLTTRSASSR
jgi:hypothetical protein